MSKIGMVSLGCAKNQVDAEVMLGLLSRQGHTIVNNSEDADIILVNTCGFIGPAKEESVNAILEQAQYKKSGNCKLLIVTGCLGERYNDDLIQEIPEIDAIVGTGNYIEIIEIINKTKPGEHALHYGNIDMNYDDVLPRVISTKGSTAYLKIAEGCDNHCTYCIIPQLRGRFRSRPLEALIQEAEVLSKKGTKELIVIAQDITRYGQDSNGNYNLVTLLKELCKISDLRWIRLMYCYPERITDELIDLIANEEKICKYLDIPIQHINDDILRRMNRASNGNSLRELLKKIRKQIPDIVIRTSLIVGFPGETQNQFNELSDFVREGFFNHAGVFPYSQEEGTKAAAFEDQISETVKAERRSELMKIQNIISKRLSKSRIGTACGILIEGRETRDLYYGRSYGEAPEVDGLVYLYSKSPVETGELVMTQITKSFEYDLLGEVYEPGK